VFIVAHKDAAAIAVESEGNPEAAQQAVQQAEIALGGYSLRRLDEWAFLQ
jgi:hypothetical protein